MTARRCAHRIAALIMTMLLTGCATGKTSPPGLYLPFLRTADNTRTGFSEMVQDLRRAQMVFLGELHDNREHHRLQLEVIKALKGSGARLTIGLEMFRTESQPALDRWVAGNMDLLAFMAIYRENWTIPWDAYDEILLYARNNAIPLLALNVSDGVMQKVYRQGFAALTPEELKLLPPDVTCRVDKPYMDFVRRNFVWHSGDEATFRHFCEAQLLRNKVMADRLVGYHRQEPDRLLVVVTGVGHAMRSAVPDEVKELAPLKVRIVIPRLNEIAAESIRKKDVDYLMQ